MELLPWVFTSGWASGINSYLVVLMLGVLDRVVAVAADAVAVEFSAYLVQVAVSLLGGILFFSGRLRRAEPAA